MQATATLGLAARTHCTNAADAARVRAGSGLCEQVETRIG